MSEVYVEHLVKREKASGLKFLKILLIMLTVVFGLMGLMMMFYGLPLLIAFGTGVGAYFAGLYADVEFEYLDCIPYEGKECLVLLPAEEAATDVVILEVEPVDEETENYLSVQDEALLNAVYDIFKEKYKDVLTFEEE